MAPGAVDGDPESAFPQLAGSHLALSNAALEFVKSVCQVRVASGVGPRNE